MKLCFTSDLHGREALYAQLDALLAAERPRVAILGGDMLDEGEIDDPIATQGRYLESSFMPRIAGWRRRQPDLRVACILGNHDWQPSLTALEEHHAAGRIVLLSHERHWSLDGVAFVGFSLTPPTPYWVKDFERLDLPDDPTPLTGGMTWCPRQAAPVTRTPHECFAGRASLREELARVPSCAGRWILVAHAPPHHSDLDRLPHVPHPVGSRAVREFIQARQPLCSLHGHIHESPAVSGRFSQCFGGTLSVNPGQGTDRLQAVLFDTDDPAGSLRHTVFA